MMRQLCNLKLITPIYLTFVRLHSEQFVQSWVPQNKQSIDVLDQNCISSIIQVCWIPGLMVYRE